MEQAQATFSSSRVDTAENLETIRRVWDANRYLLCPHSSVGAAAPLQLGLDSSRTVVLATAHPAKFPDAVRKVTNARRGHLPKAISAIGRPENALPDFFP